MMKEITVDLPNMELEWERGEFRRIDAPSGKRGERSYYISKSGEVRVMTEDEAKAVIKENVSTPQVKLWVPEDEEFKKTDKYILMRHIVTNEDAMVSEHYIELMDERGYRIVKT